MIWLEIVGSLINGHISNGIQTLYEVANDILFLKCDLILQN
ncbi:hypothetical protein VCHA52P456_10689 [Vibrio chagasii]|nr:hypothetical protein VCHA52P456_10689 [Vibrio chagasii]